MKFEITHPGLSHLESIVNLAKEASFIVPNTKMIYYLCCTVFSEYSFIATIDNKVCGYLYTMPDWENNFVWLHQIVVDKKCSRSGIGQGLINEFENYIKKKNHFSFFRCAIKSINDPSKQLVTKFGYQFIGLDSYMDMELYEKNIKL
jgi:ribosomal protein S18 acetylase RimI-like enzyme